MIAWLSGTWLGKALAGAVALIFALLAAWGLGRRGGAQRAREQAAEDYADTRKRADGEDYLDDDIGVIRDRLRERGER